MKLSGKISLITIFFIFIFSISYAKISNQQNILEKGIDYYNKGKYELSISAFLKIINSGLINGELCYNLGNAYLKNDQLGYAVLWYEKAKKYMGNDPDLSFNLAYVLSLVKDKKGQEISIINKVLFFWKHLLSTKTLIWLAIIFNAIFWIIIMLQIIRKKKIINTFTSIAFMVAAIFILTVLYNFYENKYDKSGVILPEKISIRSGLTIDSTELFVLHAGTVIKINKSLKNHYKITYSKDKIGWIKKSDIGVI